MTKKTGAAIKVPSWSDIMKTGYFRASATYNFSCVQLPIISKAFKK